MCKEIRILIVDDHTFVRSGLRAYLSTHEDFVIVGSAASGEEAVDFVEKNFPDIVLMEMILPGMSGVEAIHRIKQISPNTHVVVLTNSFDGKMILSAYNAGATTLILKDIKMDQLIESIRDSAKGVPTIQARVAFLLLENLSPRNGESNNLGRKLSDDEINLLNLVIKGYSYKKIADELSISEYEVKSQESGILRKLRLADPPQIIQDTLMDDNNI